MVAPSEIQGSVIASEVTVRASLIVKPKGHIPLLIFRYLTKPSLCYQLLPLTIMY